MSEMNGREWFIHHGDCIPHMAEDMEESSVDMSVHSPPFPSLYAYTDSEADIGNVNSLGNEAKIHLGFYLTGLLRVLKPGRVAIIHVAQIPRMKRSGGVGLCDYRGLMIRLAERAGFIYEYDWSVRKNPQAQAIRTRSRELQFSGLESDRAATRGALNDYLIKLRKPGENKTVIDSAGQVGRENWIKWAEGCWDDIRETDTLNTKAARSEDDTRHICPLQLEVINRLIRLFTNPNDIVFSPFAGIGSEGYIAVKLDRRFYGCELKGEYFRAACKNISRVVADNSAQLPLF